MQEYIILNANNIQLPLTALPRTRSNAVTAKYLYLSIFVSAVTNVTVVLRIQILQPHKQKLHRTELQESMLQFFTDLLCNILPVISNR